MHLFCLNHALEKIEKDFKRNKSVSLYKLPDRRFVIDS